MNKSEEEQLLQDASSLLMFANLAAKQRLHAPQSSSQLQLPVSVHQRQDLALWSQGQRVLPSPSAYEDLVHPHGGIQGNLGPLGTLGPLGAIRGYTNVHPYPQASGSLVGATAAQSTVTNSFQNAAQPIQPYHSTSGHIPLAAQTVEPTHSAHTGPMVSRNPSRHSVSEPLGSMLSQQQQQQQHPNISGPIRRSSINIGNSPPSYNRASPISIASLTSPMLPDPTTGQPGPVGLVVKKPFGELLNPTEPAAPVKSVLQLDHKHEHRLSVGDLLSNNTPTNTGPPLTAAAPNLAKSTNTPPVVTKQQPPLHKRTPSNGYHHSPGPADIALMRGIMDTSSTPRVHDARIAAAALAAAADIPLPLRKDERMDSKDNKANSSKKGRGGNPNKERKDNTKIEDVLEVVDKPSGQNFDQKSTQNAVPPSSEAFNTAIKQEPRSQVLQATQTDEGSVKTPSHKAAKEPVVASVKDTVKSSAEKSLNPIDIPKPSPEIGSESVQSPQADSNQSPDETAPTNVKAPPLNTYKVDPDLGLIGCICGIDDDDGFTVQCDICYRWQHCLCMNFTTNEEIPDEYECYYCDKSKWGKFDAEKCKRDTLERLGLDKNEDTAGNTSPSPKKDMKRKSLGSSDSLKKRKTLESKSKKKDDDDKSKSGDTLPDSSSLGSQTLKAAGKEEVVSFLPNPENDQLEGGMCVELYQGTYYKLRSNDFKTPHVRKIFESVKESHMNGIESLTKAEFQKKYTKKFSHRILPKFDSLDNKLKTSSNSNWETSIQVKPYSENQKQKFNGIQKLGLFISSSKEAHTIPRGTPITEYLGEISLLLLYKQDRINQYHSWGTTKPRVVQATIPLKDSLNDTIDFVSDARFVGNEARFIRNSCPAAANCELKVVYNKDQKYFSLIVITTKEITLTKDIHEEELRLEWLWDEDHPVKKMFDHEVNGEVVEGIKFDQFTEAEKSKLIPSIDTLLTFVECACSTASAKVVPGYQANCVLFKIKKATAYLLRSTRKVLLVSSLNMSKSRDALIVNKKPKEYISWDERLQMRDKKIAADLEVTVEQEDEDMAIDEHEIEEGNEEESGVTGEISFVDSQPGEVDSINKELKETRSWNSVSYKEKLLAKSRTLKEINVKVDSASEITEICAPIVPDLVIKIQKTVREKIEVPALDIDLKLSKEEVVKEVTSSILPPVAAPLPVKKLSFADYKKKMK